MTYETLDKSVDQGPEPQTEKAPKEAVDEANDREPSRGVPRRRHPHQPPDDRLLGKPFAALDLYRSSTAITEYNPKNDR